MNKPALKKTGFLWECSGAGCSAKGKTISSAYANWFRALVRREADHQDFQIYWREKHKKELQKLRQALEDFKKDQLSRDIPDEWVIRRINFYNQKCIEHIWETKTLPTQDQYRMWTIDDPSRRESMLREIKRP